MSAVGMGHALIDGEYLSADEKRAMELTGELANLLRKICITPKKPEGHSASLDEWKSNQNNDWAECAVEVHAIQHRIMAQAAARAYPDKYRLMGAFFDRSETLRSAPEGGTVKS